MKLNIKSFKLSISNIDKIGYSVLVLVTVLGVITAFFQEDFFVNVLVVEDGIIENLTAILLLITGLMLLKNMILIKNKYQLVFVTTFLLSIFFLFIAGEEISWGQRIFNIESTGFFMENNTQQEMNFHNLKIAGIPVNRLLFGQLITIAIISYLLLFPLLYDNVPSLRKLINKVGIPVGEYHHLIMFLVLTGMILLIPSGKKWELYEFALSVIFLLIILKPKNNIYSSLAYSYTNSETKMATT
ncbi:MAG TPA: hypothetical protein VIK89_09820 [Cytophagaceae bacterium]